MFQPNFEEIRKKAISDMLDNMAFKHPSDKAMAEVFAQYASIVTANMLTEYHRQLMEHLKRGR